ncbi:MAG TPA: hypothetical protein VFF69_06555 [Phycisphaerales bacterium]|nr:hypothetical protein [Phycisphaerales bacterium]
MEIGAGTMRDYAALAGHHYRPGAPATVARRSDGSPAVLAARDGAGRLAGVLVVSMPTLNGAWRELAWPGRFRTADKRADAARLNRELRCISRVVVHPAFRSCGVAAALVASYLGRPLTGATEAVAEMGRSCGFFGRAGMSAYPLPPSRRDARLLDALGAVGLEPWELLIEGGPGAALGRHPWLAREARLWAEAHGATRRLAGLAPAELLAYACSRVAGPPFAYAHGD